MKVLNYESLRLYDAQLKAYISGVDFIGTSEEANNALANGTITDGMKVYITDDYSSISYSDVLVANSWTGESVPYIYDLGIDNSYDFEVTLASDITVEQLEALQAAQIVASGSDNLLRAYGEKPIIDIPVIVRRWVVA